MNRNSFIKTWMYGLTIFVLIIVAGILTGISLIPLAAISYAMQSNALMYVTGLVSIVVSIYFLGWVFLRFKVRMKGR